ncbi:hypothetical protein Pan216_02730 [Planctomycetes bacterium Pan216]|uniref:Uncharacterized protein n=1 Tax=Kolteria novifilia TaxID=2527975 RepID=A0A518AXJ0_9BACT|nr:hypothetical protein Pan216_02730 [Planctomycetes bacterium Pan216]
MVVSKRSIALVGIVVVSLLVYSCWMTSERFWQQMQLLAAYDSYSIFEHARIRAVSADVDETADQLAYIVGYYPSGTRLAKDSPLDKLVECCRNSAIRELIALLKEQTDKDLGNDPVAWILVHASDDSKRPYLIRNP